MSSREPTRDVWDRKPKVKVTHSLKSVSLKPPNGRALYRDERQIAPGMSDIGLTLSSKESKHDSVEDRQHFRRMAQTNLSVVFAALVPSRR